MASTSGGNQGDRCLSPITHQIVRRAPWSRVPAILREITVRTRSYYLLSTWLRNNPPNEEAFRIKQLAEDFDLGEMTMRQTLNRYRAHSKLFLKYIPIPNRFKNPAEEWNWAIQRLHHDGFFMINPREYLSKFWVEPSFRQFEDYNTRYFGEAVHRAQYRLEDAVTFSMAIDGIDIRRELEVTLRKRAMLESS